MAGQQMQMPMRQRTEDVAPGLDPSGTSDLLLERIQAWRHVVVYIEDYIREMAKDQDKQAKDQEKILKIISHPVAEAHHFEQSSSGVTTLLEHLRVNTQSNANLHVETSQNLTGNVLPMIDKLYADIKTANKELSSGANKGSKSVDRARVASQRHIELLSQNIAAVESVNGYVDAQNDPYVLHRGLYYRLNSQIHEENSNRDDMLSVQESFQQFEAHVLSSVQAILNTFNQFMSGQADRQKALYGDITATAQKIPHDFEWNGFIRRYPDMLINPNALPRTIDIVKFPNQNHRLTQPLMQGTLERKSRLGVLKGYSSGYYVVTPAGYLHEYKNDDNFEKDPMPETSLYLPESTVGPLEGNEFAIRGKDQSHGRLGSKFATTSEYKFRANTSQDAQKWYQVIAQQAGIATHSAPTSPVDSGPGGTQQQEQQQQQQPQTTSPTAVESKEVSNQPQPPPQTVNPTATESRTVSIQQQPQTTSPTVMEKQQETGIARGPAPQAGHSNTAAATQTGSLHAAQSAAQSAASPSEKLTSPSSTTGGKGAPTGPGSHFHR